MCAKTCVVRFLNGLASPAAHAVETLCGLWISRDVDDWSQCSVGDILASLFGQPEDLPRVVDALVASSLDDDEKFRAILFYRGKIGEISIPEIDLLQIVLDEARRRYPCDDGAVAEMLGDSEFAWQDGDNHVGWAVSITNLTWFQRRRLAERGAEVARVSRAGFPMDYLLGLLDRDAIDEAYLGRDEVTDADWEDFRPTFARLDPVHRNRLAAEYFFNPNRWNCTYKFSPLNWAFHRWISELGPNGHRP